MLESLLLPFESDRYVLHPIAQRTEDTLKRDVWDALYLVEAFKQDSQCDFGFQTGKGSTKTEMDAMPEGEMAVWIAPDIKGVGIRKLRLVAIGRIHVCDYPLTRLDLLSIDDRINCGYARKCRHWGQIAQYFL
jgi:hypothetical protein